MLKRWLDERKIEYTNYMVDQNPIAAQQMVNLSGQMGVPFTTIETDDGKMQGILGYDVPTFKRVLDVA